MVVRMRAVVVTVGATLSVAMFFVVSMRMIVVRCANAAFRYQGLRLRINLPIGFMPVRISVSLSSVLDLLIFMHFI